MSEDIPFRYWVEYTDEDGDKITTIKTRDLDEVIDEAITLYDERAKKNTEFKPKFCGIEIVAQPHCMGCNLDLPLHANFCLECDGEVKTLDSLYDIFNIISEWQKRHLKEESN